MLGLPVGREVTEVELVSALAARGMSYEDLERMISAAQPSAREKTRADRRAGKIYAAIRDRLSILSGIDKEVARTKIIRASYGVEAVAVKAAHVEAVAAEAGHEPAACGSADRAERRTAVLWRDAALAGKGWQ